MTTEAAQDPHFGLTPEEIEALTLNDDETPEEAAPPAAEAATPPAEEKKDEPKPDDGSAAAAAADDATAAAAKPATEDQSAAAAEPAPAQSAAPQPAPVFVAEAVKDAEVQLATIATQKEALGTKFDDGDITAKEYQAQIDALNKQERQIERAQDRAQLAAEMDEQAKKNAWFAQAQTFATANGYTDQRRLNILDAEVRAVATAEPTLDGAQVLAKAHQNLVDAGLAQGKTAPAPAPAKAAAPKPEIPPSTHKLPASEVDNAGGGEWAELDRLMTTNPLAYEAKLASMSDAQRDRYLQSA